MAERRIVLTKEIPVAGSYDVVVVGGGPAGLAAAVAAKKAGNDSISGGKRRGVSCAHRAIWLSRGHGDGWIRRASECLYI